MRISDWSSDVCSSDLGVAPDHQSIKAVSRRYEATALTDNVRFVGNIELGESVTVDELLGLYHAVIIATGAPADRKLGIPGEDLKGEIGRASCRERVCQYV